MAINGTQFLLALEEIEASKGISKEVVLNALKEAMIKGYKKQIGATDEDENIFVNIDPENGNIEMYQVKKVVKEVMEDDFLEISVEDANELDKSKKYKVGDDFIIPSSPDQLTKAIAMSVKSILKQKFAEAEKDVLYEAFKDKIGTMITGRVERADERGLSINVGKTSVYLPHKQMIGDERFNAGDPIKLFVSNVNSGTKGGAQIQVSRASEGFLKCLFTEEIHEIYDGTIVIKAIAREAGERSKVAVYTEDPNIDPAGACIGPNGSRIQKIVGQLGNGNTKEKIDIIGYSQVPGLYIIESLKPARIAGIIVDEENKSAIAIVKDDSLSLAIGKKGVNARLAVKLTGYNIDIKTESVASEEGLEYQTFEELQALDTELKSKAAYDKLAAQYQAKEETVSSLPGLPEGYVAPQQRVYQEEENNEELQEALEQASEKEEIKVVKEAPKAEVKEEVKAPVEEAPAEEKKEVKTTTSLEDLEKSLSEESNKQANKGNRRYSKKKKAEEEEDNAKGALDTSGAERMSIYTEEELRQMEEEDRQEEEQYDDDVDYDDYDDYYDDDDR